MPIKRKGQPLGLDRRVRPKKQEDWELEQDSEQDSSDDQASEQEIRGGRYEQDNSDSDPESENENEDEGSEDEEVDQTQSAKAALSSISFGALARAQASLPASRRKSKQSAGADEEAEEKQSKRWERPEKRSEAKAVQQRTSKHAPQEQSSKKPVSRRREVVHDNRRKARDPRFDAMLGASIDESKSRKAYAFLDDYRESEMADLRAQIKKAKTPDAKEELKRELMSMESRKKARVRKDEEDRLLKEHKKAEKDLVAQGKTPFYLKKSEQKKQVLTNRFNKMSKGAVDRAIERKRKKVAGKEKKELDFLQRVPNRH